MAEGEAGPHPQQQDEQQQELDPHVEYLQQLVSACNPGFGKSHCC